jgi:hypothetical protein
MRVPTSAGFLSAALLLAFNGAAAQEMDTLELPRRNPIESTIGFDLITSRIQDVAAEQVGTGTRAWGGQAIGSITAYRVLTFTGEFGIVDMSDERPFSQGTTEGEKSSSVSSFLGTVAAGLRTPPLALAPESSVRVSAGVSAGHTFISTERSIVECVDCHEEDLEIRAGNFVEPAVYLTRGRGGLNARYRMYGGDSNWENALIVGYTWSLRRVPKQSDTEAEPAVQP